MKTTLFLTIILFVYKLYTNENKIEQNQNMVAKTRFEIVLSDTTNTFHDDFDSSFTFNGSCVGYTFKKKHICNGN